MITEKKNSFSLQVDLLNDAPIAIVIARGKELEIDFANKSACALMQSKTEQIAATSLQNLLPALFPQTLIENIQSTCLEHGKNLLVSECELVHFIDGKVSISWFDLTIHPSLGVTGIPESVIIYFADVSARVKADRPLAQHENFLLNLFNQAPVGLVLYRGENFIVDLANGKALEIWGKSLQEVKGKSITEVFSEVQSNQIIKAKHAPSWERMKRGESHVVSEVELTFTRNGVTRTAWYNYIHEPYRDISGKPIGMITVVIEVTDQVVARRKLELITDSLPSLVSYVNNREEYEFVNTAYERWFSKSKNEVVGKTLMDVLGATAYANVKGHVAKALSGELDSFESWLDYREGGKRFISAAYVPHFDENKRVLGYFGLVNDLTERKKYEQTTAENEERMRLLIEGIGAGTFDYDLLTGSIHWSDTLKNLLGIPVGKSIDADLARSIVHPDDLATVLQQVKELHAGSREYIAIDYRIVRKDNGVVRWVHSRSRLLFSEIDRRQPVRVIGFTLDVTDRKVTEEKLREFNRQLESEVHQRTSDLVNANQLLVDKNEELTSTQSVLQQLIDSSIELIAVIDRDLKFLAINEAFEKFVNKKRIDLVGKHILEAFQGAKGTKQVELLQKALSGERLHLKANPSIAKPNDVWFDTHFVPLEIHSKIEGVIVLSRNITDIVRSEQALAKVNKQLEEAQRLSKLGSWEWEVNSGNVIWSDEMYRIYGYESRFPVDFSKATERMSPEHAERSSRRTQQYIQLAVENFKRTGELTFEISSIEFPITLPDGTEKLLRSSGKLELNAEGNLQRVVGAIQDVTEIRQAEERLRLLVDELSQKNKDLESFNYVASHDLQEPLRKIQTFIDRIKNGSPGQEAKNDYLNRIDDAAKRMTDLIQSMLTLGRLSKQEEPFTEVDLNVIVDYCKSEFDLKIREMEATIECINLPTVRASDFQMRQLFINLMSNSFKFSTRKPLVRIECSKINRTDETVSGGQVREYWRVIFSDNGIGFDPQYKDRIFEPFQRLHSKNEFSGTGVGLSIVKRIVERHGGFIEAVSQVNQGATFLIDLPVTRE